MRRLVKQFPAIGGIICVMAAVDSSAQSIRTISYSVSRSIIDRVLPDDEVVVVQRSVGGTVYSRQPTSREFFDDLVSKSAEHGIYVVNLLRSDGRLVDDGRWIYSEFTAAVFEDLRPQKAAAVRRTKGDTIQFSRDGGQLVVGGVLVKTDNAVAFSKGQQYLVFLGPPDAWTHKPELQLLPLLLERDRIRSVESPSNPLDGLRLAEIRRWLRNAR